MAGGAKQPGAEEGGTTMNKISEAVQWIREGRTRGVLMIIVLGAGVVIGLWFTIQDSRGELEITADVLAADRSWRLEEERGAVVDGTVTDLHLEGIVEAAYRASPAVTGPFGLIDLDGRSVIVASRNALPIGNGTYHGTIKGLHGDDILEEIRTRQGDPEIPPIFVDLDEQVRPVERWLRVLMTGAMIVVFVVAMRVYIPAWRRRRRFGPPPPPPPRGWPLPPPASPPPPTGPPAGPVPWNG